MISGIIQTGLFIAQWILILELLWITCILIPFTILAITFRIFEWMLFDIVVGYLVSGSWSQNYNIVISSTAPIMIMLYVALIFGFICAIIFFITYATRNIFNPNGSEMIRKMFWIFSIILFILLIPFIFLILAVFIKFLSNLVISIFANKTTTEQLLPTNALINNINYLKTLTPNVIDEILWNQYWASITNTDMIYLKNQIYNSYTKINNLLTSINFNVLLEQLQFNINNPAKIQAALTPEVVKAINELSNEISNFASLNVNLEQICSDPTLISNINSLYCPLLNSTSIGQTILNINHLNKNLMIFANVEIVNGQVLPTSNVGFVLYYAITGIYVNSVNGIINNLTFIPTLFQSNGVLELGKAIGLGAIVAVSIYKGVFNFVIILINRWFSILSLIPFGAISLGRISNDNGDIFKIWIRELISVFASLFVVSLNYQIFNFLISIVTQGFISGNIQIHDIGTSLTISIAYCIFVILILYTCTSLTTKILDTFANSHTLQNQGMNQMVSEYNKNQSRISNRKNQASGTIKPISKKISRLGSKQNSWLGKANVKFKNWFKTKFKK